MPTTRSYPTLSHTCKEHRHRTTAYERSGKRLGLVAGPASSSTRSRGGSSLWHEWSGAGQACPSAVLATACCTATASMPHQRRDQPAAAARRRAGGALCDRTRSRCCTKRPASPLQRPPTSEPRTTSSCGPPLQSSGYGPFAALGYPEHGPICFSGSRLRMPRAREG